jgi:hypothetical protein
VLHLSAVTVTLRSGLAVEVYGLGPDTAGPPML